MTVTSQYPGATAAMVMRSVTTPLEININGSDGLQYMQSYSSANGTSVITCTFALGTDPTTDQTNVQHGVDLDALSTSECRSESGRERSEELGQHHDCGCDAFDELGRLRRGRQ